MPKLKLKYQPGNPARVGSIRELRLPTGEKAGVFAFISEMQQNAYVVNIMHVFKCENFTEKQGK